MQRIVTGGQSMNPSTAELLEAVEAAPAEDVVILPNNKNIVPVAEQVGDHTSKRLFEVILEDEEHHIDYLDAQLELLEKLGEALYLAQAIEQPNG